MSDEDGDRLDPTLYQFGMELVGLVVGVPNEGVRASSSGG